MIGVSEERFWDGTPSDLEPYDEAYDMQRKITDANNWMAGYYTMNAVMVAVSRCLNGKKSKASYMDKPILSEKTYAKQEEELSEEEIKRQRKALLAKLQVMQANFEMNHNNDGEQI